MTFPTVSFFEPAPNFPAMRAMGINTVAGPEPTGTDQTTFAKSAQSLSLNVILKNPVAPIPANCVGFLLTVDEPNENKGNGPVTPVTTLKTNFDALRKLSATMPIYVTIGGDRLTYQNWPNAVDRQWWLDLAAQCPDVIPLIDHYSANKSSKYSMGATATGIANVRKLTGLTCHAFQECDDQQLNPPASPETNGAPSPAQIAESAKDSLAAGAQGIWWFFTDTKIGWPLGYLEQVDRHGVSMAPQYAAVAQVNAQLNPVPTPLPAPALPPPPPPPIDIHLHSDDGGKTWKTV